MQAITNKFSIYWQSIFVVTMVLSIQACIKVKYGAATPDRVVEQYLLGLETKDKNLIQQLAPESSDFTNKIQTKIGKIGGHKIQDRQVIYTKPKPVLWKANIRGFYLDRDGNKQKIEDSIVIEYQSKGELKPYAGRWYLVLGDRG